MSSRLSTLIPMAGLSPLLCRCRLVLLPHRRRLRFALSTPPTHGIQLDIGTTSRSRRQLGMFRHSSSLHIGLLVLCPCNLNDFTISSELRGLKSIACLVKADPSGSTQEAFDEGSTIASHLEKGVLCLSLLSFDRFLFFGVSAGTRQSS